MALRLGCTPLSCSGEQWPIVIGVLAAWCILLSRPSRKNRVHGLSSLLRPSLLISWGTICSGTLGMSPKGTLSSASRVFPSLSGVVATARLCKGLMPRFAAVQSSMAKKVRPIARWSSEHKSSASYENPGNRSVSGARARHNDSVKSGIRPGTYPQSMSSNRRSWW